MILKSVIKIVNPMNVKRSEEKTEYKLVTPSCVKNSFLESFEYAELDKDKNLDSKYLLEKGDILFLAKGNKIDAVLIDQEVENLLPSTSYLIIKPDTKKVNPKYLQWLLKTQDAQAYFNKNSSGATIKIIRKNVLEELEFECPSLDKQEEFAKLIENFELERKETEKYLELKEELIERKILERYEVKLNV